MLFDWLYPAHMPTLLMCLEAWADVPDVTTSLLKFMAEFVLNKSQRLTFDSSSPNGILLFREVSKVGNQIKLIIPKVIVLVPGTDTWVEVCATLLCRGIVGIRVQEYCGLAAIILVIVGVQ